MQVKVKSYSMLRQSDDDYELELVGAPDEVDHNGEAYQNELKAASDGLRDLGYDPAVGMLIRKALGMGSLLLGTFVIAAGRAGKPFVPVLTEWVKAKAGRTVRLKKGDIEAEAHTVAEIERLWEIASKTNKSDRP